jgi:hypothetical protein
MQMERNQNDRTFLKERKHRRRVPVFTFPEGYSRTRMGVFFRKIATLIKIVRSVLAPQRTSMQPANFA